MISRLKILGLILLASVGLSSCKTYTIPVDSFKKQLGGIEPSDFKKVYIEGAIYGSYMATPIEKIQCIDKNGNPYELTNSPAIEIRFTYGEKSRKTTFYFDTILLTDSVVIGHRSRLISSLTKEIPINSITKIEIQNGGKKIRYVNK